ncbi:MAG TPA: AMP-binding protein [Thermohalobaculum sp.]|nr:AMP-binding protein [Thermohalobaculum sp.]
MNLSSGLARVARRAPESPAVLWDGGALSYAEFEDRAARIAGALRGRHGLEPGAHVGMAMENAPEFLPVLYGIWRAGMAAVPINSKLHPREMAWILANAGAPLCIASPKIADALGGVAGVPEVAKTDGADYAALLAGERVGRVESRPDDHAWIFYTSGTTGRPKGAVLTQRNLWAMSLIYLADVDRVGAGDLRLHAAPMSHGSGLYALPFVMQGAANLVHEGFEPERVFEVLARHERVSFFAAPTMVMRLVNHPAAREAPGLKTLCYGGAPMYLADLKRALALFGPRLYQLYGQGECPMTITHVTKAMHGDAGLARRDEVLASAGFPRSATEVAVVDADWTPVPDGEPGEIAVRSDCVMAGYLGEPEATAATIRDGWLRTGDVGVMDPMGFVTLKDRAKDLIISGGANIYPREVEEVLLTAGGVAEAAVVGRPHPDWGEEVVAFVVPRPGAAPDPAALERHCLAQMARFKRPKVWRFVAELPKNNYGKVLKTALRETLAQDGG